MWGGAVTEHETLSLEFPPVKVHRLDAVYVCFHVMYHDALEGALRVLHSEV